MNDCVFYAKCVFRSIILKRKISNVSYKRLTNKCSLNARKNTRNNICKRKTKHGIWFSLAKSTARIFCVIEVHKMVFLSFHTLAIGANRFDLQIYTRKKKCNYIISCKKAFLVFTINVIYGCLCRWTRQRTFYFTFIVLTVFDLIFTFAHSLERESETHMSIQSTCVCT